MKIAFSTSGNSLESPLDSRFGRARRFLIYDLDENTFEMIDNHQSLNAAQGAGIQTAETIARSGVNSVVTGHCGPKAFRVLSSAGIKIYNTDAPTVAAALEAFRTGRVQPAASANVDGHWV